MSSTELIFGIVVVLVVGGLAVLVLTGRGGGKVRGALEAWGIKFSLEVSREARQEVESQLDSAIAKTGKNAGADAARQHLESTQAVKRIRVLWVDDHPGYNTDEKRMLSALGLDITQATSTAAAMAHLQQTKFGLLITDLGRDGNPDAGLELLDQAGEEIRVGIPAIVYTMNPGEREERARSLGAAAVTETPGELLDAVLTQLGDGKP
jgi:CheY-like chemotaxis protein